MSLWSLNVEYSDAETPAEVATSPASTAIAEPKGKHSNREETIIRRRMTVSSESVKQGSTSSFRMHGGRQEFPDGED
jgi:hypothetical protein